MTSRGVPWRAAADVDAPRAEWAEKMLVSMPDLYKTCFTQRDMVSTVTPQCGFRKLSSSLRASALSPRIRLQSCPSTWVNGVPHKLVLTSYLLGVIGAICFSGLVNFRTSLMYKMHWWSFRAMWSRCMAARVCNLWPVSKHRSMVTFKVRSFREMSDNVCCSR